MNAVRTSLKLILTIFTFGYLPCLTIFFSFLIDQSLSLELVSIAAARSHVLGMAAVKDDSIPYPNLKVVVKSVNHIPIIVESYFHLLLPFLFELLNGNVVDG